MPQQSLAATSAKTAFTCSFLQIKYNTKKLTKGDTRILMEAAQRIQGHQAGTQPYTDEPSLPDTAHRSARAQGLRLLRIGVNTTTGQVTVGLALASFVLGGGKTWVSSHEHVVLSAKAFTTNALEGSPGEVSGRLVDSGVSGERVFLDHDLATYSSRGHELCGPECSPFLVWMHYTRRRAGPDEIARARQAEAMQAGREAHQALLAHIRHGAPLPSGGAGGGAYGLPDPPQQPPQQVPSQIPQTSPPVGASGPPVAPAAVQPQIGLPNTHTTPLPCVAFQLDSPLADKALFQRRPKPVLVSLLHAVRQPAADADQAARDGWYAFVLGTFKAYRDNPVPAGLSLHEAYMQWWDSLDETVAGHRYKAIVARILSCIDGLLEAEEDCRRDAAARRAAAAAQQAEAGAEGSHSSSDSDFGDMEGESAEPVRGACASQCVRLPLPTLHVCLLTTCLPSPSRPTRVMMTLMHHVALCLPRTRQIKLPLRTSQLNPSSACMALRPFVQLGASTSRYLPLLPSSPGSVTHQPRMPQLCRSPSGACAPMSLHHLRLRPTPLFA